MGTQRVTLKGSYASRLVVVFGGQWYHLRMGQFRVEQLICLSCFTENLIESLKGFLLRDERLTSVQESTDDVVDSSLLLDRHDDQCLLPMFDRKCSRRLCLVKN